MAGRFYERHAYKHLEREIMPQFTDSTGVVWEIAPITYKTAKRFKAAKIDMDDAIGGRLLIEIQESLFTLGAMLWVVCEDQAVVRKVSEDEFAQRLGGEALDGAREALLQAVIDFFPKQREQFQGLVATQERMRAEIMQRATTMSLEELLAANTGKDSAASTPASSA